MESFNYIDEPWDELLDGKLVSMAPPPAANHKFVSGNIYHIFKSYLKGKPCIPITDGMSVHLSEKDRVIPDMMVVCNRKAIKQDGVHGAPDLVVEVLSPSTNKNDRGYKKDAYEKCGVKEYWIVDTANRSIEVYLLKEGNFIIDNVYSIYPEFLINTMTDEEKSNIATEFHPSLFPDLTISLADVFEDIIE